MCWKDDYSLGAPAKVSGQILQRGPTASAIRPTAGGDPPEELLFALLEICTDAHGGRHYDGYTLRGLFRGSKQLRVRRLAIPEAVDLAHRHCHVRQMTLIG